MAQGAFIRKYQTLAHRLQASTAPKRRRLRTPCWEWTGLTRGRTGDYPRINVRIDGVHRQFSAHRLAKVLAEVGDDEHLVAALYDLYRIAGFELDHECENPRCIRPSHTTWRDHDEHLQLTIERRRARRSREQ
jgi:hypothetical protein